MQVNGYRVVQPYGVRPGEWTLISEHPTAHEVFDAFDALSAQMVRLAPGPMPVELLIVVDDAGRASRGRARSDS